MALDVHDKVESERLYRAFDFMAAKDLDSAEIELTTGLDEAESQKDDALIALFYSSLGVLFKIKKDFKKAWKFYEKAEKLLPHDPALKLISARLLIDVFGQFDSAIRRCKKVLELAENDPPFRHQAYATMGMAELRKGDRSKSIQCLMEAMDGEFDGLVSASNVDLKLTESLLRKKTGLKECLDYLETALEFSKTTKEERYVDLLTRLIEAFPREDL